MVAKKLYIKATSHLSSSKRSFLTVYTASAAETEDIAISPASPALLAGLVAGSEGSK